MFRQPYTLQSVPPRFKLHFLSFVVEKNNYLLISISNSECRVFVSVCVQEQWLEKCEYPRGLMTVKPRDMKVQELSTRSRLQPKRTELICDLAGPWWPCHGWFQPSDVRGSHVAVD